MSDNKEIYSRLAELAREYFLEVSKDWSLGTYSAAKAHEMLLEKMSGLKIEERKTTVRSKPNRKEAALDFIFNVKYQEDKYVDVNGRQTYTKTYDVYNSGKLLSVEVGTFKASFDACKVFDYLTKFEVLAKVSQKDKVKFIRQEERDEQDVVLSFDVTVTKEMAALAACVGDDELRPIMNTVHIDVDNQCAVASDGHILSVYPMPVIGVFDSKESDHKVVVVPKEMIKDPGTYHVYQCRKGTTEPAEYMTTATKVNHLETVYKFVQSYHNRYPNYQCVIPPVHKEGYMKLKNKQDVKALFAFLKSIKGGQRTGICKIKVYGKSYDNRIYFSYENIDYGKKSEVSFETDTMIQHSFYCGINALLFLKVRDWTGGFWYTSPSHAMIFDDKHAHLYLIMPLMLGDYETKGLACETFDGREHREALIPAMERHTEKIKNLTTTQPPVQEPEFISMEANKYAYYYLPDMAEGKYEVRGASDPETKLAITSMAHYILKDGNLQPECVSYVREQYGCDKKKLSELYPLSENDLATLFMDFLESKGIEDVPEYPAMNLTITPVTESSHVISADVKPTALDRDIEPFIELETDEGFLIVAAESYFDKLYDSRTECFRSEAARAKFDEIDAFISDKLVYERPLNIEAIAEEVEAFMQAAENAV